MRRSDGSSGVPRVTTSASGSSFHVSGSLGAAHEASLPSNDIYVLLCSKMHSHGLNLRYLGRVRSRIEENSVNREIRAIILLEIIARCIKNHLRHSMREKRKEMTSIVGGPYVALVVRQLNVIFSRTVNYEENIEFWQHTIKVRSALSG